MSFQVMSCFERFPACWASKWPLIPMNEQLMLADVIEAGKHLIALTALQIPDFVMNRLDMRQKAKVGEEFAGALFTRMISDTQMEGFNVVVELRRTSKGFATMRTDMFLLSCVSQVVRIKQGLKGKPSSAF